MACPDELAAGCSANCKRDRSRMSSDDFLIKPHKKIPANPIRQAGIHREEETKLAIAVL